MTFFHFNNIGCRLRKTFIHFYFLRVSGPTRPAPLLARAGCALMRGRLMQVCGLKKSAHPAFFTSGPRVGQHGPPRFAFSIETPSEEQLMPHLTLHHVTQHFPTNHPFQPLTQGHVMTTLQIPKTKTSLLTML